MPDPEFARISYRGQNTETARVVVPEVSKQSNLAALVLVHPGFAYKKAPYQTRRLFSLPLTRILVWRRATKYLRRLHVSHRRSLPGSFQRMIS